MTMRFAEWVDFLFGTADGHCGDAEELAEEIHGGEFAQVEDGCQDPLRGPSPGT
ncbi:hypothetical protein P1S61_30220 [Streptomyces sp. ME08-AFT2]|uniref:hypothetical protein n=1 Tax=Streptomyces TaxID=1883 RepID=UPI0029AB8782|nr:MULTISPECIES: hypothetical protein [Streptomyces]MDX3313277.1 hypothetical protein [Streptomyces sp. ME08-AFT2]